MNKLVALLLILSLSFTLKAKPIVEDQGVTISAEELSNALVYMPPSLKVQAIEDQSFRKEILRQILENKKIEVTVNLITAEKDQVFFWRKEFATRKMLNELYLHYYENNLKLPDMEPLAKERYTVNKTSYAAVPEKRASSHVLFECLPGSKTCDRVELRKQVEKIYADLKAGADFEVTVEKYSDDTSSKARKGKLPEYSRGQPNISGHFLAGLFAIEKVGDYSNITETRFGFHIIRLDKRTKKTYKEYEEVKPMLIAEIKKQFKKLSLKKYMKTFSMSKEAIVDDKELDDVFKSFEASMNKEKIKK